MTTHGKPDPLGSRFARQSRRCLRGGLAALEVVMAAGITLPILAFAAYVGFRVCRFFFSVLGTMIGSPYM
jgi:hypothetical protein